MILNAADLIRHGSESASAANLIQASRQPSEKRGRLLVVDDSLTVRTQQKALLEMAGYEVMIAVDGAEGWELLQEKGADLVVSDVEMPRMDGFRLTEMIRGSERFAKLPVILVTALETAQGKARGLEVGANAYLLKSGFDQKNLLETIAQML